MLAWFCRSLKEENRLPTSELESDSVLPATLDVRIQLSKALKVWKKNDFNQETLQKITQGKTFLEKLKIKLRLN